MEQDANRLLYHTSALVKAYRSAENGAAGARHSHGVHIGAIRIPRGGVIALVGASGTGKTTLFNLLGGLDEPDREDVPEPPRILLDLGGPLIDLARDPDAFPRDQVGFVFQSGFLLRNASAGLNLALPLAKQGRAAQRADLVARLDSLGIPAHEFDERAWKFSGGEAQRIAFVRALAHDPQLVFADEPTSNVDYRNAAAIMGQLRDWTRDRAHPGRTVLWITHDLRLAATIADAVLVLHEGRSDPVAPVCLPGDPQTDLEWRARVLEDWTYHPERLAAAAPPEFQGLDGTPPPPAARPGLVQRTRVRAGVIRKVGLSEVFSRHAAQRRASVRGHVNPALSLPGAPPAPGGPTAAAFGWLIAFGQWSAVFALMLISVLGAAGLVIYGLVDEHFSRSVNDPRNCHLIIKTYREQSLNRADYGSLDYLSTRPWQPAAAAPATDAVQITPRATCLTGPAAYGRRDARFWGIALADDGRCPAEAKTTVRLLTADRYEPIWTKVGLLASAPVAGRTYEVLADYLDQGIGEEEIFLSADKVQELEPEGAQAVVGRQVCLFDSAWPHPLKLWVKGVVDEVPSWQQNRFAGFIPNDTYDAFSAEVGLTQRPTHIALYFASTDVEALSRFLEAEQYDFVAENLNKIRRLVESSTVFKGIVSGFLGLIGLLLVMLTAMQVQNYLNANSQSFALLKAFGMSWRFVAGILLVEVTTGWLVALALTAAAVGLLDLATGGLWWQSNGLALGGSVVWRPLLAAAAMVWLLSAGVSLWKTHAWWRRNRYVAQVLKAG